MAIAAHWRDRFSSFLLEKVDPFLDDFQQRHLTSEQLEGVVNSIKLSETEPTLDVVYQDTPLVLDRLHRFVKHTSDANHQHVLQLESVSEEMEQANADFFDLEKQLRDEMTAIEKLQGDIEAVTSTLPETDLNEDIVQLRESTQHALFETEDASGVASWLSSKLKTTTRWLRSGGRGWDSADTALWQAAMNTLLTEGSQFKTKHKPRDPFRAQRLKTLPLQVLVTPEKLGHLEQLFVLAVARAVHVRRLARIVATAAPLQENLCKVLRGLYHVMERFAMMDVNKQNEVPIDALAEYIRAILSVEYLVEWQTREKKEVEPTQLRVLLSAEEFNAIMIDRNWYQVVFGGDFPELSTVVEDAYEESFAHPL